MTTELSESAPHPAAEAARPPVLIAIGDPALRDEVRRAAAAAGRDTALEYAPISRHAWKRAPMVVLDRDTAIRCAVDGLPRRPGVILVGADLPELADWQAATSAGAETALGLPAHAADLVHALGDYPTPQAGPGAIVAVLAGSGGAGASVFAAALALRAAATQTPCGHVLLVDGDPTGSGLDVLLGLEDAPGLRWPGLVVEAGRVSAGALHAALPGGPRLSVLSAQSTPRQAPVDGPSAAAAESVLYAGRDAGDLVICDVGRQRGTAADAMIEAADLAVLVVTADLRSALAAAVAAGQLRARNPNLGVLVRGPAPGGLRAGKIAAGLDLPLLASMRAQPGLGSQLERGGLRLNRRGPLHTAADTILTLLSSRPTPAAATRQVRCPA